MLLYDLGDYENRRNPQSEKVAELKAAQNDVRIRARGTIAWDNGNSGDALHHLDSVLTLENANTTINFQEGGSLTVAANSLVTIEKADTRSHPTIELAQGRLSKSDSSLALKNIRIKVGDTYFSEDQEGASFSLIKDGNNARIAVTKGRITSDTGHTLGAGEQAEISESGLKKTDAIDALISLDKTPNHLVTNESSSEFQLEWALNSRDSRLIAKPLMKLTITRNGETILEKDTYEFSERLLLESDNNYEIQLRTNDPLLKETIASKAIRVHKIKEANDLRSADQYFAGERIDFRWLVEPNIPKEAVEYKIELAHDEDFERPLHVPSSQWLSQSQSSGSLIFHRPRTVFWRVRAQSLSSPSQSIISDVRKIEIKPKPQLPAPRVKEPRIRIRKIKRKLPTPETFSAAQKDFADVAVDLEWDPVDRAVAYKLEVAKDSEFKEIILKHQTVKTRFILQTRQSPKERSMYFRVLAVDRGGKEGEFSPTKHILIEPYQDPTLARLNRIRIGIAVGSIYHSRKLNSDSNPETATASGFVPALVDLTVRKRKNDSTDWFMGLSIIAEQGEPTNKNVLVEKVALPLARITLGQERDISSERALTYGLYASNTHELSWKGRSLKSERKILLGAVLGIGQSQKRPLRSTFSASIAPFAMTGIGADISAKAKMRFGPLNTNAHLSSHFFSEAELLGRISTKEISYGGAIKIGYYY